MPSLGLAEATVIMEKIAAFGFTSIYDSEYPVPVDMVKRIQVRDQITDPVCVKNLRYALQVGAIFPPLVFTADEYLLDGHQRHAAYIAKGVRQAPAVIITQAVETATQIERDRFVELGVFLNLHGKSLTFEEKKQRLLDLAIRNI